MRRSRSGTSRCCCALGCGSESCTSEHTLPCQVRVSSGVARRRVNSALSLPHLALSLSP